MKAVIQRVSSASVTVENTIVSQIKEGYLLLLGVAHEDTDTDIDYLLKKTIGLRIFPDEDKNMNLSLQEAGGSVLVVSQFTLCADTRKGRRPSFIHAAPPEKAEKFYLKFCSSLEEHGVSVEKGAFGAMMQVQLTNEGPVTIVLDSRNP
ncbi:MAG: D-aminoacyl-tRNA deacylase [Candidatus Marinimicrobia bacterium]|jgi:D-tyrosyl-tRNA(Tyr) deacylase|nr:D-aminoacyl-tRNA deacylase [Candidatus Neomarinimicrobiota bacterium]MDP6853589.1 D-aminoacyl-tRNA deacylase [Candidatus Neomarinimicrobiota bacterium]MDP6935908.1 D-aminoacyl-tRNA deacylase [Candidatus Neomarinimicrobiota bacterium]